GAQRAHCPRCGGCSEGEPPARRPTATTNPERMVFMNTDYSHSTQEIQIFRRGDLLKHLQLLESLFHNVERFVFLRECEANQTTAEAWIRSIKTGAWDRSDTNIVNQPRSERHIVVTASKMPEVRHHIVGAFGNRILKTVLVENAEHA